MESAGTYQRVAGFLGVTGQLIFSREDSNAHGVGAKSPTGRAITIDPIENLLSSIAIEANLHWNLPGTSRLLSRIFCAVLCHFCAVELLKISGTRCRNLPN
jgi:hypothetical protein